MRSRYPSPPSYRVGNSAQEVEAWLSEQMNQGGIQIQDTQKGLVAV